MDKVKIISISAVSTTEVFGLGDNGGLYRWHPVKGVWQLSATSKDPKELEAHIFVA